MIVIGIPLALAFQNATTRNYLTQKLAAPMFSILSTIKSKLNIVELLDKLRTKNSIVPIV